MRTELIPFRQVLAVAGLLGSGARLTSDVGLNGLIKEIVIHWPPGCNSLVDVLVGYQANQFLPREGFLALDGTTFPYRDIELPVVKRGTVFVVLQNRDGANPHTITVTIKIEGDD